VIDNVDSDGPIGAAIDIGSNSIKMTIGRGDEHGGIEQIDWATEVVRLGQGLEETGRLDEERIELAIETLVRFVSQARERGATRILAVATEAARAAANGAAFLELARAETGIDVRIIDGDEEAALTFRGIAATTEMTGTMVVADIGGGSTELILVRDGTLLSARSLALGSGRLTDRLVVADPPTGDELATCAREARSALQSGFSALGVSSHDAVRLLLVGGTGEYLARLAPVEQRLNAEAVETVLAHLASATAAEVAAELAIPEARARVLPAGVAIVGAIVELLQPARIDVSRGGVRAGLLLEALGEAAGEHKEDRAEPGYRETMRHVIGERWEAVWRAAPVALEGTDIEGVHDVRVASRRLRAAMDIAAPVFPQKWYRTLHRTAKEITKALGEVRDRDVLLVALRADREAAPAAEWPGIDRLIDRVESERIAARAGMERFLQELLAGPVPAEVARRFGLQPGEQAGDIAPGSDGR
jgi:hypothetical protein